ncbi:MAG: SlyX family protein [Pirellulaceae bacterium]
MRNPKDVTARIIELESNLGLLQRDYEIQNQMLLNDKRRIDQLELAVSRLLDQVERMRIDPNRSALDEKPPHY